MIRMMKSSNYLV